MLYIVYCRDDASSSATIRSHLITEHIKYLERNKDIILLGGAMLAEDGQTRLGSALILSVPSWDHAVMFSKNEPFRNAGLYTSVEITRMRRGQWHPANVPKSVDGD